MSTAGWSSNFLGLMAGEWMVSWIGLMDWFNGDLMVFEWDFIVIF